MIYLSPAGNSLGFDFRGDSYVVYSGAENVVFDFRANETFAYPEPLAYMVSSNLPVSMASPRSELSESPKFSLTPSQKQVRNALSLRPASDLKGVKTGSTWDRVTIRDIGTNRGGQGWEDSTAKSLLPLVEGWRKISKRDDRNGSKTQQWGDASDKQKHMIQAHKIPSARNGDVKINHSDSDKYHELIVSADLVLYIPESDFSFSRSLYTSSASDEINFDLGVIGSSHAEAPPTRALYGGLVFGGWSFNPPVDNSDFHPWDTKPRKESNFSWDYYVEPNPEPRGPDQPEIKESYIIMNSSYLQVVGTGMPLEFAGMTIDFDIDSVSWAMSCKILNKASMDLIKPSVNGLVEVEAMVNNHTFRFYVERYTLTRKFPSEQYRVKCIGLSQLLASPYSAKIGNRITTATNALTHINSLLNLTGFVVNWDMGLPDYTIPAGAWGYDNKSPIEVISELVGASGGVVVPSINAPVLNAQLRYSYAGPWDWDGVSGDDLNFIITESMILGLSSEWQASPSYNRVYLSGVSAGVAVEATITGTAGDVSAPDVIDELNLTAAQSRNRGISILGQAGDQEIVTIEIPLPTSGSPGLVIPGAFGEIQEVAGNWRCLVLSNSISVNQPGASKVTQTLKVERHHY